ncbi:MAG: hypothetical protein ABIV51_09360 [Saprospiraceae bacterium]
MKQLLLVALFSAAALGSSNAQNKMPSTTSTATSTAKTQPSPAKASETPVAPTKNQTSPQRHTPAQKNDRLPRLSSKEAKDIGATDKQITDLDTANKEASAQLAEASKIVDTKEKTDKYAAIEMERTGKYNKILNKEQLETWKKNRDARQKMMREKMQKQKENEIKSKQEGPAGETVPLEKKKG